MKKRLLLITSFSIVAVVALLVAVGPTRAAQVMGFYKAATVTTGDTVFVYKKTASGTFQMQVADPITINTVANGGTGATTAKAARTALGIPESGTNLVQFGTITTAADGTVTNAFTTAYVATPFVIVSPTGGAIGVTNKVTITTTNFIYTSGQNAQAASWVAIGK